MLVKPVWVTCNLGQESVHGRELYGLVLLNGARMEMLPEDAPLSSPCRTIRKEAESPLVSGAAIGRISECLEHRWSNAELTVQCSVSACGRMCSRNVCPDVRVPLQGSRAQQWADEKLRSTGWDLRLILRSATAVRPTEKVKLPCFFRSSLNPIQGLPLRKSRTLPKKGRPFGPGGKGLPRVRDLHRTRERT